MKTALLIVLLGGSLAFAEDERTGASFKEGVGIQLGETTRVSIGLELATVEERVLAADVRVTAQVYREAHEASQNQGEAAGYAYASAWVDPALAERLPPHTGLQVEGHPSVTGRVLRVDRTASANGGRAELLLQLPDGEHPWKIGTFVHLSPLDAAGPPVTVIPDSAVLETVYGPFVYVVNGRSLLRTAVRLGARSGHAVEVIDGLYGGDQVAVRPVETLYLIELRATKGGGHSH
jgi:hypothetical protein